jgi:hypothetical protein
LYFAFRNGNDSEAAPSWNSYGLVQALSLSQQKKGNTSIIFTNWDRVEKVEMIEVELITFYDLFL